MKASRISLTSAIAVVLTLCLSTLCLNCATQRQTGATIPAGPQLSPLAHGGAVRASPGTPASRSVPQPGKVQ